MEIQLAGSFLLLLAWLPAGLAHQISSTMDVAVGLDLFLQRLPQRDLCNSTGVVMSFATAPNSGEKEKNICVEVKKVSAQIVFSGGNSTQRVTCTCRTENTADTAKNGHKPNSGNDNKPATSNISRESTFKIRLVNLTVHMKGYRPECLEVETGTPMALGESCTNLTSTCTCARINSTATGSGTPGTVPSSVPLAPQTNSTRTWEAEPCDCKGLKFLLCIIFGLALGTLLYVPAIGVLLWQCRRDSKGKLKSSQMVEVSQLSTVSEAAPETGAEDLTYSNLKFEKKGTKPTSSDVIYTEIKPPQQKQSGGDAGAANAGMDVSPEGEGK